MEEGNFIIGGVSAEEVIASLAKNGAEVIGDRDYSVVYLKNVNNENDMKAVVYFVDNYQDFDPDFPECPKVQVLIGDPRNKNSFVSTPERASVEVERFISGGYEEFCCSTSKDVDLYLPGSATGDFGRKITVTDYVVGDQGRPEEYPYSVGATILKDRGCSVHSNCAPWTSENVEELLERSLGYSVVVNATNRDILTVLDIVEFIKDTDEETFEG